MCASGDKVQLIINTDFKSKACCEIVRLGSLFVLSAQTSSLHTPTQFGLLKSLSLWVFSDVQLVTPQDLCLFMVTFGALGVSNRNSRYLMMPLNAFKTLFCAGFCYEDVHSGLMFWLRSSVTVRIIYWMNKCWSVTLKQAAEHLKNHQEDVEHCCSNSGHLVHFARW